MYVFRTAIFFALALTFGCFSAPSSQPSSNRSNDAQNDIGSTNDADALVHDTARDLSSDLQDSSVDAAQEDATDVDTGSDATFIDGVALQDWQRNYATWSFEGNLLGSAEGFDSGFLDNPNFDSNEFREGTTSFVLEGDTVFSDFADEALDPPSGLSFGGWMRFSDIGNGQFAQFDHTHTERPERISL